MHSLGRIVIALVALFAVCSLGAATGVVNPSQFNQKIIGYWGCYPGGHQTTLPQLTNAINKGYNVIIYAFYLVGADGSLSQDPGSIGVPTKAQIQALVPGKQFTYLISLFGGQNGAAPTLTMTADAFAQKMFDNFKGLNTMYGFDGIDIDLENAWGGTGDVVLCSLRSFFKLMHNYGFVVSMAPQTSAVTPEVTIYQTGNWNSYAPLMDSSIIDYVDIVAVQLYNNAVPFNDPAKYTNSFTTGFQVSGCPRCDGTVTGFVKVPASKLAHGYPSTAGAAPSGCPGVLGVGSTCPYGSQLTSLYAASSVLLSTSGVMTWSIEWDEVGNWAFANGASQISFTGNGRTNPGNPTTAPVYPTAAPVNPTAAPVRPTAAPVNPTAAPVNPTAAPVLPTAAPVRPTAAPVNPTAVPPPAQATTRPGNTKCNIRWTQTLSSSWTQGCNTVSMYSVTMVADAPLKQFKFGFSSPLNSIWDAKDNLDGTYQLPDWMFNGGVLPKGYSATFGYIIVDDEPATISVTTGDPCQ